MHDPASLFRKLEMGSERGKMGRNRKRWHEEKNIGKNRK